MTTQTHLYLLSCSVHELSDKVNGSRLATHMDLLCTQSYTHRKKGLENATKSE